MATTTTYYGLSKPAVNSATDEDLWGDEQNANMDVIDAALHAIATSVAGAETGTIKIWSTSTAPSGYLECDGAAVSRSTYATLFGVLGTTWGAGDGSTTFNVPDLRGYFIRGWAHGGSIDSGRAFASTQADANLAHTHTASVTDPGHTHTLTSTTLSAAAGGSQLASNSGVSGSYASGSGTTGISVTNTSSGGAEARPKNVAILFVIKT